MIEVYIDGASAGDPGDSGAGIFIKANGEVERYSIPLGQKNNHEAEFLALIHSLKICKQKGHNIISVRSDSKAVVHAVEKEFAKREPYKALLLEALNLIQQFELFFIKWVPSSENKTADSLARHAIRMNKKEGLQHE
ncbi:reverse transcriptase-like protein [Bacillus sp. FJAT-49736]|uniref:reverse transcriptase-like protein n=1 Tax=Bacillus sp. FJAT-49736 TaxID=2833582 RepID=UPI001BCA4CB3|nr:reverse transcriptase-like protein [Bacillus sp. FJAT-49736]MBS4173213.1 reverse transcriptase-like protein [Bacillus sp. FJAT-49736]